MIVRAQNAVIYRTPEGRRYFTKAAAYRRAAFEKIKEKYPCDCTRPEVVDGGRGVIEGETCERHERHEYFEKVAARLARWMARADRRVL